MKIEIVSGQPNANIKSFFEKLLNENGLSLDNPTSQIAIFPEHRIAHPITILNDFRAIVAKHIDEDEDLYVLTYSDYILSAIRLEVKKHKFSNANVHQLLNDGTDHLTFIDRFGYLGF